MTGQLRHPAWRRSSYSTAASNCVEVALSGPAVGVRDSKDPDGPVLATPVTHWAQFLVEVAAGDFDC
jgi:Domain of unknown function (DUF397)